MPDLSIFYCSSKKKNFTKENNYIEYENENKGKYKR